jgi:L-asparaginase / beta-aspartyl-peptidase
MILVAGDMHNSGTAIAWELMRQGKTALESIEQGIRAVELNPVDQSVGVGGFPNALGEVELDGGVMDGRTRASGAVGALKGFLHPVSVAYAVKDLLPHVLLVGDGAARFAAEIGAERGELLTEETRQAWHDWCQKMNFDPTRDADKLIDAVFGGRDPQRSGGTTVYLAQDSNGDIAAATSTSGWAWKYPGRLGDTPIAGAGFYADNRYGAAACTGQGEIAIRSSLARMTVALIQMGRTVEEAVREALADILYHKDQTIGITVYAIDNKGGYFIGCTYDETHQPWYYAASGDNVTTTRYNSNDLYK